MQSEWQTRYSRKNRLSGSGWVFAAVAIGVHLLLLLIPLRVAEQERAAKIIEIDFIAPLAEKDEEIAAPESEQELLSEPATAEPVPLQANQAAPVPAHQQDKKPSAKLLTTTLLLEQLKSLVQSESNPEPRKPGFAHRGEFPKNWNRPLLPSFTNLFQEEFAPIENEVLDQWVEPGGARRVVMRTPSGHTVCGRLDQWDPINPLFEPVPMYHLCAGGGRRKQR